MIKEFLDAIFAPNKLMAAIEQLREENARLRHEMRHYTEYEYQQKIEPFFKDKEGYMQSLYRHAWQRIGGAFSRNQEFYEKMVVPLSVPERGNAPFMRGDDRWPSEKLVIRVKIRMPEPMLQGVPVPCEEDPDWVLEEYALQLRKEGRIDKNQPFVRISMTRRLDVSSFKLTDDCQSQELISRVAVVRFERDGTPYVVTR